MKRFHVEVALGVALAFPEVSFAQTAQTGPIAAQEASRSAQDAQADANSAGDIIVTAQRREDRLQDVPIAITAVTADQLQNSGVDKITDIFLTVPGVSIPVNGAFAQPTIRGIGTTATGVDSNVATYVDGVYQPSQVANIFSFNNISQIEILKGPQGTLFGRNSTGGAILITTLAPSTDRPSLRASASYGSFDEVRLSAYGNVPLGAKAALNVAALYIDDNGYAQDVTLGQRAQYFSEFGVRSKLRLQATDTLSFTVTGFYHEKEDTSGYGLKPLNGSVFPRTAFIPASPREISQSFNPEIPTESYGASVVARYDRDDWAITSTTAWSTIQGRLRADLDRNAANRLFVSYRSAEDTFSQEFNLNGKISENIGFVAGLFYYHDDARQRDRNLSGTLGYDTTIVSDAYAAYGELNVRLGKFVFNGGARYSSETKELDGIRRTPSRTINSSRTWDAWTPRASLLYEITDDLNGYVTFSKGFTSGVYNPANPTATTAGVERILDPASPEYVSAWEVGLKYFRRGFSVNTSAFYYNYDDIQIQASGLGTLATNAVINAAKAEIYGADIEIAAPVTNSLTLRGSLAYTHGTYTDFPGALLFNPNPAGGNFQTTGSGDGKRLVRTPELSGSISANYRQTIGSGELRASGTVAYTGSQFWSVGNRIEQPAYTVINGSIGWGPSDGPWRLSVWGRNLTDEVYALAISEGVAADGIAYARPRSVGVRLDLDF